MQIFDWTRTIGLFWLAFLVALLGGTSIAVGDDPRDRAALLIGVGKYQNLSASEQLEGCGNDVRVMRELLISRFGYAEDQIVTLVDEQATDSAIRAALKSLVDRVARHPTDKPPLEVMLHFSGHGSQVPDQPEGDPDCDEEDGLDETLVPYNASKQGGAEDIRDDELYRFAQEICDGNRARLWMILDCCHSGTGARGTVKFRKLDRSLPTIAAAGPRAVQRKSLPDNAWTLSACRAHEVEPEYRREGTAYGLLTRFLADTIGDNPQLSSLTYGLLRDAIINRYRQDGAVIQPPTPQLEGKTGSAILAGDTADGRAYWQAIPAGLNRGRVLLKAGSFQGVTAGSLFELYEDPDKIVWEPQPNQPSGAARWLRIEKVEAATAEAQVLTKSEEELLPDLLLPSLQLGYAVKRFHNHGDLSLRVRVVEALANGQDGPALTAESPEVPPQLKAALANANRVHETTWCNWVGPEQPCDVVVRFAGEQAAIFPTVGVLAAPPAALAFRGDVPAALRGGFGPISLRSGAGDGAAKLANYLRRIARVRNLMRIAAAQQTTSAGQSGAPTVKLELVRVDEVAADGTTITKATTWPETEAQGAVTRDDEVYAFRLTNLETGDQKPVFVTLLHIDAQMGIDVVLPYVEGGDLVEEQRLNPGESKYTDRFKCCGGGDEMPIYGPRTAIALVTREPNDLWILKQENLPTVRGTRPDRGPLASLNELVEDATYFKVRSGAQRLRPPKAYDQAWSAEVVTWTATGKP